MIIEGAEKVTYMPQTSYVFNMSVTRNLTAVKNDKELASSLIDELSLSHLAKKNGANCQAANPKNRFGSCIYDGL